MAEAKGSKVPLSRPWPTASVPVWYAGAANGSNAQITEFAKSGPFPYSGHSCSVRRKPGESPQENNRIFAACARSTVHAATAKNSVPQRGMKTSRPFKLQHGSAGQGSSRWTVQTIDIAAWMSAFVHQTIGELISTAVPAGSRSIRRRWP